MAKNIVILFDGTGNEIKARRTNILRLYGCLEKSERQLVWYDPGVGSFGGDKPLQIIGPRVREIAGLAAGLGLHVNAREAYRFLCEHYHHDPDDPDKCDRIHLIGFSRGAYTARVLAGFLHAFGLMEPRNLNVLEHVYRDFRKVDDGADLDAAMEQRRDGPLAAINTHRRTFQPIRPQIASLGLFDTVASMFERTGWVRFRTRLHAFTHENPSVRVVRHAVSIDERRVFFRPRLWAPEGVAMRGAAARAGQDVSEVWFAGAHTDVGGGLPEEKSGQAKLPLAWMIGELRQHGMLFNDDLVRKLVRGESGGDYEPPNPQTPFDGTIARGWRIAECVPFLRSGQGVFGRRILGIPFPAGARRQIPATAKFHGSVRDRLEGGTGYAPPNLPADPDFLGDYAQEDGAGPPPAVPA